MQGKGWLILGALGFCVVAVSSPDRWTWAAAMGVPAGWPRIALAVGVLATAVALYFRSHWAATARALRSASTRERDVRERLGRLADDLERSAFVISDNLQEVAEEGGSRSGLFLGGAKAHASKLGDLALRTRGLASRLDARSESAPSLHSAADRAADGRDD